MCKAETTQVAEMDAARVEELLLANKADEETQQARFKSLKTKKVLWITAPCIPMMSQGMKDSAKWAVENSGELYACFQSDQDKLYTIMKEEGLFTHAIFASNLNSEVDACESVVQAVKEAGVQLDGVFTPYEMCITLVGEVAQALGLPGNAPEAYKIARSKHQARLATAKAGLATPRSGNAKSKEALKAVLEHVGYPCIVKPSSGAGSCGVFKACNEAEALKAWEDIEKDLQENSMLAYNPGCETGVVVEQFLQGDEFDVDLLMWDGKDVYSQCVFNWPCIAPYFLETGTQMPAPQPEEVQNQLRKYALDCCLAMGFTKGCFHVELMYTSEGPVLIEVNARQGGGPNQVFNLEMAGVNIFANFFMSLVGIPINPPRKEITFAMADYAITAPYTGVLADDSHMEPIRNHPNTVSTQDFVKPGGKVKGIDSGFPQWTNQFIVKGDSPDHCHDIVSQLIKDINSTIKIVPELKTVKESESQETPEEEPIQQTPVSTEQKQ